jgi:MFS transporter, PHS family, inorganic phosphate transporter
LTTAYSPSIEGNRMTRYQWRIVLTAGIGFFTDAYDLFIIGVVTAILGPIWHLTIFKLAMLNGAALAAAAFGAVFFGTLSDRFGRKKLYGFEILILFFGAILSASAQSFTWLLIARCIVGLGIGGDYPSSAVVASEHSAAARRGFLVLLVFAMQAVGLIVGPTLASLLLSTHLHPDTVWRMLLGFGAIPAASVFYLRRTIQESPHYKKTKDIPVEVSRVVSHYAGVKDAVAKLKYKKQQGDFKYKKQRLLDRKWLKYMVGTAGAWFLMDVAFYGNGVSNVIILKSLDPHATLRSHVIMSALIFFVFAVPGYALAAKYIDKIGRKRLQKLGFLAISIAYALIGLVPAVTQFLPLFILVYGLSFFFINFGPNTTTFLIPSEIYPTSIRAKAHGISAAVGKVGAFVGAFLLPFVLKHYGMHLVMTMMSVVSLAGFFITFLLPEMNQKDLSATEDLI